jgi:hypothetical protein
VEELGQESPTFEAVPVRHGRSTDVRTLWSPDNGLQLLSVSTAIASSLFLHLNANLIFALHQTAVITARCNVAKADVARQGAK